jgi:hypothetical protein
VIKDQFPQIELQKKSDSLKVSSNYLVGQVMRLWFIRLQIADQKNPAIVQHSDYPLIEECFRSICFFFQANLLVKEGIIIILKF